MVSMTGYGNATLSSANLELEVSLRSVNGRFLEIRSNLPREYVAWELELKKVIGGVIKRGTVDFYVSRNSLSEFVPKLIINKPAVREWSKTLQRLAHTAHLDFNISLRELAQMEGVIVRKEKTSAPPKAELKKVIQVLNKALAKCQSERLREGKALSKRLLMDLSQLTTTIKKMRQLRSQANKALHKKYKTRKEEWREAEGLDPQRWAQELAIAIDKSDINEELVRLQEHLKVCRQLMVKNQPQGKKLDFYCQEILREINTIGSKSQLSQLTERVVEAKAIVERYREQVQNIE